MTAPQIELRRIARRFAAVQAVADLSLTIPPGHILGLIGENGAGKSTLMRILYGLDRPDSGEVLVDGRPVRWRGAKDAIAAGIGMVHQHFMLVEDFTALENVMLGAEGGLRLAPARARARAALADLAQRLAMPLDPDAPVGTLPVGARQRVEIAKALYRGARLLILDEPTAVLTAAEADQLFALLRRLRDAGGSVVLVTHKLNEVMAITDSVAVMRRGALVARRDTAATEPAELAQLMIGSRPPAPAVATPAVTGPVVLETQALGLDAPSDPLRDVTFAVHAGEIVGIAGVSGNGQGTLLAVLAGLRPPDAGRFRIAGRVVTPGAPCPPRALRALGVAHAPEDRQRHGLVLDFDAGEAAILGRQRESGFGRWCLDRSAIRAHCADLMARYDIRPADPALPCRNLSGGNQQKLVVSRELASNPRVLLVGEPTRGVDFGAARRIHDALRASRDSGTAILLASTDLDEILALADRILVMVEGRIVGQLARAEADATRLGLLMGGAA